MSCFSKPLHPEFFIPPLIFDDPVASDGDSGLSVSHPPEPLAVLATMHAPKRLA
jgi:hypothetical protein